MVSMKFYPWIPRMEFNSFIIKPHQTTSLVCLRGDEGWGRGENSGRKVFFKFISAI